MLQDENTSRGLYYNNIIYEVEGQAWFGYHCGHHHARYFGQTKEEVKRVEPGMLA